VTKYASSILHQPPELGRQNEWMQKDLCCGKSERKEKDAHRPYDVPIGRQPSHGNSTRFHRCLLVIPCATPSSGV